MDGHAKVMRHGKQKYLSTQGNPEIWGKTKTTKKRRNKWCPVPGCTTICTRLHKHLNGAHQIKIGSVPYRVYLKEANPYSGMMELDEDPRRVLAVADLPSTSSAAPHPTKEPQAAVCEAHSSSSEATNTCPPSGSVLRCIWLRVLVFFRRLPTPCH